MQERGRARSTEEWKGSAGFALAAFWVLAGYRRDTYLRIEAKIKQSQKLALNIFPFRFKHSLDKKFS